MFINVGHGLYHLLPVFLGLPLEFIGNGCDPVFCPQAFLIPHNGIHLQQIHDTRKIIIDLDGDLHRQWVRAQTIPHHMHHPKKIRPDAIHLIHKGDPRNPILIRLTPNRLRLRFYPTHRIKDGNGPIQDPETPLHLDGKIHMAGGIDDIDSMVPPKAGGGSRGDGDASLLLLLHPIHGGGTFIHLTDLVRNSRIIENPFRRGRFTRINMGHDAYIAGLV